MVINEMRWRRMVPHSFYEISYPLNRESIIFENHHLAAGAFETKRSREWRKQNFVTSGRVVRARYSGNSRRGVAALSWCAHDSRFERIHNGVDHRGLYKFRRHQPHALYIQSERPFRRRNSSAHITGTLSTIIHSYLGPVRNYMLVSRYFEDASRTVSSTRIRSFFPISCFPCTPEGQTRNRLQIHIKKRSFQVKIGSFRMRRIVCNFGKISPFVFHRGSCLDTFCIQWSLPTEISFDIYQHVRRLRSIGWHELSKIN